MTLIEALKRSINTIAVKLSVTIGNGNREARPRQDHQDCARRWVSARHCPTPLRYRSAPTRSPCSTTPAPMPPSPISARRSPPHAILEVRTGNGDVVWRFDRDGPKPRQVMPEQVALDMIFMMNKAVEEGTGQRAMLDGIRIAGKTGTTNDYRDAWFVGYTGNFVAGVWFGNDDYSRPTA